MITLLATFGYCVVSALLPFVNAEAYLLGVATLTRPQDVWLLAGCAALGQLTGKLAFYYAGRGGLQLPRLMRWKLRPGRWTAQLGRWRAAAENRPVVTAALVLVSAFAGLPPFAAVSVFAGVTCQRVWLFGVLGLVGRYGRFACLLCVRNLWRQLAHQM